MAELSCELVENAIFERRMSPEVEAHVQRCARCDKVWGLSEHILAVSQGGAPGTIGEVFVSGQELLGYRLDRVVGSGGQGVVFQATEMDVPGSVVALKIVHRGKKDQAVREVAYAKRINHPNVCRVNTTKSHGDFRLIEMEFVDGGSLANWFAGKKQEGSAGAERSTLSREERIIFFRGVLAGLEAVHEKGILHLDLKPANILLRVRDGNDRAPALDRTCPVVSDFGLSTQAGGGGLGGTAGWTAPEVTRGETPDVRADVYSAGAVLATLLPDACDSMAAVVARAKSERREDRYPNVAALRVAFEEALHYETADATRDGSTVKPGASLRPRARKLIAVALVVAAGLAVAGAEWRRRDPRGSLPDISVPMDYEIADTLDFRLLANGHREECDSRNSLEGVNALPYLREHGINVTAVMPERSPLCITPNSNFYDGRALAGRNLSSLAQFNSGNGPASYTLVLSKPVERVDITLPGLIAATDSGVTFPAWSVHALDAGGNDLANHSEMLLRQFHDERPRTYTLETHRGEVGAAIAALRFDSDLRENGKPFAGFGAVVVGRIVLSRRR
jgi:hypothetical protein